MKYSNIKFNVLDALAWWKQINPQSIQVTSEHGWAVGSDNSVQIDSVIIDSSKGYPQIKDGVLKLPFESDSEHAVLITTYSVQNDPCVCWMKEGAAFESGSILTKWSSISKARPENSFVLGQESPEQGSSMSPLLQSLGYMRFPTQEDNIELALDMVMSVSQTEPNMRFLATDENGTEIGPLAGFLVHSVQPLSDYPDQLKDITEVDWVRVENTNTLRRIKAPFDAGYGEGSIDDLTYAIEKVEGGIDYGNDNTYLGMIMIDMETWVPLVLYSDIKASNGVTLDFDKQDVILIHRATLVEPEEDPDPDPEDND